jgi:hypothetical protein
MNCEVMNVANKMFENIQSELEENSASIKDLKKSIDELKSLINNLQPNNVISHQKDNDSLNHMIKLFKNIENDIEYIKDINEEYDIKDVEKYIYLAKHVPQANEVIIIPNGDVNLVQQLLQYTHFKYKMIKGLNETQFIYENQIIKDLTETQFIYEKQLNVWEFIDKVVEEFANETVKYLDHLKYETYDRSLVISINSRLAWKSKWRCLAGVDPKDSSIMVFHKVTIEDKKERGKFPPGTSNWHFVQCLKEKQKLKQRET